MVMEIFYIYVNVSHICTYTYTHTSIQMSYKVGIQKMECDKEIMVIMMIIIKKKKVEDKEKG